MKHQPDNFFNFEPCIDHARQVREALVRDPESSRGFPSARRSFARNWSVATWCAVLLGRVRCGPYRHPPVP